MSDTPTPRTAKQENKTFSSGFEDYNQMTIFARELERETIALKEELDSTLTKLLAAQAAILAKDEALKLVEPWHEMNSMLYDGKLAAEALAILGGKP